MLMLKKEFIETEDLKEKKTKTKTLNTHKALIALFQG